MSTGVTVGYGPAGLIKGLGSNPSPFLGGGDANRVSELNVCHSREWG